MEARGFTELSSDYYRVEQAIRYLEAHHRDRPDLDEIAAGLHMSKYHFHRLFRRWAGITPLHFQQVLTLEYAKQKLAEGRSVLDAALEACPLPGACKTCSFIERR
jgi:AraC family transcriptional regulator of adaptative response/methylated-DNA-[protein]-cysteine methyltransferase